MRAVVDLRRADGASEKWRIGRRSRGNYTDIVVLRYLRLRKIIVPDRKGWDMY